MNALDYTLQYIYSNNVVFCRRWKRGHWGQHSRRYMTIKQFSIENGFPIDIQEKYSSIISQLNISIYGTVNGFNLLIWHFQKIFRSEKIQIRDFTKDKVAVSFLIDAFGVEKLIVNRVEVIDWGIWKHALQSILNVHFCVKWNKRHTHNKAKPFISARI